MAKKTVKLDDVAREAGVSKTTVSRVLNKRGYLSDKTVAKVNKAIKKLHYRPNVVARQLYRQQTHLVALIFPTVDDPFFAQLEAELERRLGALGYGALMGNSQNEPEKERQYLKQLLNQQVDGLIVGAHNQGIAEYDHTNLPIVAIERYMNANIPTVTSDNYHGGELAVQRLLNDGCRHIIHTNYPSSLVSPNELRQQAYEDILHQHGMKPITYPVSFDISESAKEKVFRKIFREHPEVDGIFADNDTNASLIIRVGKEFGRHVPDDLKVVGYDGANITRMLSPELTTIQQPLPEMATKAVELLMAQIDGKPHPKHVKLPVRIINSTTA